MKKLSAIVLCLCILCGSLGLGTFLNGNLNAFAADDGATFPFDFESGSPFTSLTNITTSYTREPASVTPELVNGDAALNGSGSLKISSVPADVRYTVTNAVTMAGIDGFSKTDFSTVSGVMLRMKVTGDANSTHPFVVTLSQSGVAKNTYLAKGAVAYDLTGASTNVASANLYLHLPAGFDGFLFLPFESARSEQVTTPGSYDSYQTYPNSMVDLSKEFKLEIWFGQVGADANNNTWDNATVYIDDMDVYSGNDAVAHQDFLKGKGYTITAVAQPNEYSFPLVFDDYLNPYYGVNDVYSAAEHQTDKGITVVEGADALSGTTSIQIDPMRDGNSRTETNPVKMAGIEGFTKTDFSVNSGIMLRLKIEGNTTEGTNYQFRIRLNQSGVSRHTWLGYNTKAYDLDGNEVLVSPYQLGVRLPANFDGFLFIPLSDARSENVTVAGYYDRYDTYPDSMVDLSNSYTMTFVFDGTNWSGATATFDDVYMYSGSEAIEHHALLKDLGYVISAVAQPSKYSFPMRFDDLLIPFVSVDDVYSAAEHWRDGGITTLTGTDALMGTTSIQVDAIREGNSRTELTAVKMAGIEGFDKYNLDPDKFGGIMLRIKLETPEAGADGSYEFRIALRQSPLRTTWLGRATVAYDTKGNIVNVPVNNLTVKLPANFDGYLFMPLNSAQSETVTVAGSYDRYETYPDSMVDLAKEYTMSMVFYGENWGGTVVKFDDIFMYTGEEAKDHYNLLKRLGYNITAVAQPNLYTLPLRFDDYLNPYNQIDNVYSEGDGTGWKSHPTADGLNLVTGNTALNGSVSLQLGPIKTSNNRTDTNVAKMAGIDGLSKSNLANLAGKGIMLRLKVNGDGTANKVFRLAFSQTGVARTNYMGNGAIAYGLDGNFIEVKPQQLGVSIPNNFDGFLFLPFENMRSENVTETGYYDTYQKYPDSMIDFSKDFSMFFMLWEDWGNLTVTIDDIALYNGTSHTSHLNLLKSFGYNVTAIPQPAVYELPFDFDAGMRPFNDKLDSGKDIQYNKNYGTGGTVEYVNSTLGTGKALELKVPADVVESFSIYTSNATVKADETAKGFLLRIKTNAKEGASLSVYLDWQDSKNALQFGRQAILLDIKGNQLDPVSLQGHWLGANLPANFDGYVFIPFASGFSQDKNAFVGSSWKFAGEHKLSLYLYTEDYWAGTTTNIDYFGYYYNTDYQSRVEEIGYTIDYEAPFESREVYGDAAGKFMYVTTIADGFDGETVDDLRSIWQILEGKNETYIDTHSKDNVDISMNQLVLKYKKTANGYTTGAIRTADMYSYGYYEASIALPKAKGTESVLRLVSADHYTAGGTTYEISVAYLNELYELTTGYRVMEGHKSIKQGAKVINGAQAISNSSDYHDSFNTYGILYTYKYIRFYVNGVLVRTIENDIARGGAHIELATNVVSESDEIDGAAMYVDYMRYWYINMNEMSLFDQDVNVNTVEKVVEIEKKVEVKDDIRVWAIVTVAAVGIAELVAVLFILLSKKKKNI